MRDRNNARLWPLFWLLLCLVPVVQGRTPSSFQGDVDATTAPTTFVSGESHASSIEVRDVPPDNPLTSTMLLDYSSRARATKTSDLLRSICRRESSEREVVQQCNVFGYASLANWTDLKDGLRCLPSLDDIYWQRFTPMPGMKDFFDETLPSTQLHIDINRKIDKYNRSLSVHQRDFLPLVGTANLGSLKSDIEYSYDSETERFAVVQHLFAGGSSLRGLELTFGQGGCITDDGPQPRAFAFQDELFVNSTLAPLHHLKLHWYDYDGRPYDGRYGPWLGYLDYRNELPWPFSKMTQKQVNLLPLPVYLYLEERKDWLYSEGAPSWLVALYERFAGEEARPKTPVPDANPCLTNNDTLNIDLWLGKMSFSEIESLEIDYLVDIAASRLFPNLRSLSNLTVLETAGCSRDTLLDYLHRPHQPLAALHLPYVGLHNNTLSTLVSALQPSASRLRALTLPLTITPTTADLANLSTLPNLTSLTMHHPRTLPLLSSISSDNSTLALPFLNSLTLHVPSPGAFNSLHQPQRHDFLFNRSTLTSQLQDQLHANITPSLTRLEVLLGEWSRRLEVSMAGPPLEVVGRYVCERVQHSAGEDESDWQCSGGLRTPTIYSGCDGRCCGCDDCDMGDMCWDDGDQRPFVEGPKGAVVIKGEEAQGTDEDEEGRMVLGNGWVVWEDDESEDVGWRQAVYREQKRMAIAMGMIEYDEMWDD